MSANTSWLDDPVLARRLSRYTWIVLVGGFVTLTRFDFGDTGTHAAIAAMIVLAAVLNAPVVRGLWRSRDESGTRPFRLVAFALTMRLMAVGWVVWMVTSLRR